MPANDIIAARLDLIAAKARILAEQYKANKMWDGDLTQGLDTILSEISNIKREGGHERGWSPGDR